MCEDCGYCGGTRYHPAVKRRLCDECFHETNDILCLDENGNDENDR